MNTRIEGFKGFMFIGDPHLASYRPGRRQDDYQNVILDKLRQAAVIATTDKLVPIILGDLFHKPKENDLSLIYNLSDVCEQFPIQPVTLEGNHDKSETRLTDKDTLKLVSKFGIVRVITATDLVGEYDFEGSIVRLYAVPYGAEIPKDLPEADGVTNIIITHHDLNFSGTPENFQPLREITNCKMLVNGHIHKKLPSFSCGGMRAHNPGNIARLSIDVKDEVPSVWEWAPAYNNFELKRHILRYTAAVFDLTGENVQAESGAKSVKALEKSLFAELVAGQTKMEGSRSDDASGLKRDMDEIFEELQVSEPVRLLLGKLRREAVKALKAVDN